MTEYDANGFAADRPWRPETWQTAVGDQPTGMHAVAAAVPPGFLVIENGLNPQACARVVHECQGLERYPQHAAATGGTDMRRDAPGVRTSETVDIYRLSVDVVGVVRHVYQQYVAPYFRADIEWFERPEVLRYGPGGEYKPHADADHFVAEERRWQRVADRDLSVLLYLSDQYEGGEIAFPNFGFQFKPKAGVLVAFPSDARYLHTARPVTHGERWALVSWAAVRGTPRVGAPRDTYQL